MNDALLLKLVSAKRNGREISRATFKWEINNFNINYNRYDGDTQFKAESPEFIIKAGCAEIKCQLLVYVNDSFSQKRGNFATLALNSQNNSNVPCNFSFYMFNKTTGALISSIDSISYEEMLSPSYSVYTPSLGIGMNSFVNVCAVKDKVKDALINDNLMIMFNTVANLTDNFLLQIDTSAKRLIHFEKRRLQQLDNLEQIVDDDKFSDVIFNVNGKVFHAHKIILTSQSQFFAGLFESDMKESKENLVTIEDINPDVFKEMLRFMYSGKVNDIKNVAHNLLAAADKYCLEDLKDLCEDTLCKNLSIENAIDYLKLADFHNTPKLKQMTINYIASNGKYMIDLCEFKSIGDMHPNLINEIIRGLILHNN